MSELDDTSEKNIYIVISNINFSHIWTCVGVGDVLVE